MFDRCAWDVDAFAGEEMVVVEAEDDLVVVGRFIGFGGSDFLHVPEGANGSKRL